MGLSKRYNLFNINFLCLFGINFIICLVFYMSTITSTDFVLKILHLDTSIAGLITGAFVVGALLSRLYFGSIIDEIDIRKIIFFSLVFYFCINLAYLVFTQIGVLLLVRFFSGVFYGICSCACGAAIARIIPSNKRGIGIGYYASSVVLASALGPFLAIKFTSLNYFNLSFIIASASIFLALLSVFLLKVRAVKKSFSKKKFSVYNYFEKSVLDVAFVSFLIAFPFGAIIAYTSVYTQSLNLSLAGSLFFVVYAGFSMLFRPLAGRVFDKKGANIVIIFSLLCFILCLIFLSLASNSLMILLAAVFCALGYANATSSMQALSIKLAPKEKMGLANTTFFIALDLGIGISPYILGHIEASFGFSKMFAICIIFILLALFFYYIFIIKNHKDIVK